MIEQLVGEGATFDFFQAVRLLHRANAKKLKRVGRDGPPGDEAVRFSTHVALSFPASSVVEIQPPAASATVDTAPVPSDADDHTEPASDVGHQQAAGPYRMSVAFMGMAGAMGVLPHHYTSQIISLTRQKDLGLGSFLDLFNHRLISLFYRAWEKYRFPIAYESEACHPSEINDPFSECLFSMIGFGTPSLRQKLKVSDETLLHYSGALTHSVRSMSGLEQILEDYFSISIQIVSFHGQWLQLRQEDRSCMPRRGEAPGNVAIGSTLVLGDRVWDIQSKFLVRIGPLNYDGFKEFMPDAPAAVCMFQLIRTYVGTELDFVIQPVLFAKDVPECGLGAKTGGHRLGRNAWLKSANYPCDFRGAEFSSSDL
jgi:type VI secretion system protein ImpH